MPAERARPAWEGSDRRSRLPSNWPALREEATRLNPDHVCHWCRVKGGSELDHKQHGDAICQQPGAHGQACQCNLDWIHNRADYDAGRSRKNCHGEKTGREGAQAARAYRRRPPRPDDVHPALR